MTDDWMNDYGKRPTQSAINAASHVDSKQRRIDDLESQLAAEKEMADRLADVVEWDRKGGRMEVLTAYRKARGM